MGRQSNSRVCLLVIAHNHLDPGQGRSRTPSIRLTSTACSPAHWAKSYAGQVVQPRALVWTRSWGRLPRQKGSFAHGIVRSERGRATLKCHKRTAAEVMSFGSGSKVTQESVARALLRPKWPMGPLALRRGDICRRSLIGRCTHMG